ncbi:EcsC family protein [Tropicimonas isoalkanivorans]|uniref:EcsC protein family protein n=1 Tax=Tropicimonas isoalkanivorans TaxID=441112 RepID=A0A1I1LFM6_9RHOB|nr:EcsC family protein [Tropicimonas isoalkanivorans]SFC71967.1 EcsC protein family protein [Tropicimonas isoalkanivorans]
MSPVPNKRPPMAADILREALQRQRTYEERRSTRMGRGAERLTAPVGGLISRLVPSGMVREGLQLADRMVGLTLPPDFLSHSVEDLDACEAAARRVQAWAVGVNAASGGAAGWLGAPGMTADIPATIALAVRNVRATGAAFGFNGDAEEERAYRLLVLQVATSGADVKRDATLASLSDMATYLASPGGRLVLETGGRWLSDKVVERIARQLGVSLARRKAGQVVPIVGGAVAAVVNASFQTDVSRAARYAYRMRWLMARRLLDGPSQPHAADAGDSAAG